MAKKAKKIEVNWTGAYPNLCSGKWIIKFNGVEIIDTNEGRNSILSSSMATYGSYSSWHFEDWSEVFDQYDDGYEFSTWQKQISIKKLFTLIESQNISLSKDDKKNLYEKLQEHDWRNGSCGGCI